MNRDLLLVPKGDFALCCVPIFKLLSKLIAPDPLLKIVLHKGSAQVVKKQNINNFIISI